MAGGRRNSPKARVRSASENRCTSALRFSGIILSPCGEPWRVRVNAFNKAVGSFETRLLPGIRRFRDLGATAAEPIPPLEVVEPTPRLLGLCPKLEKLTVKMEARGDGPDLVQINH